MYTILRTYHSFACMHVAHLLLHVNVYLHVIVRTQQTMIRKAMTTTTTMGSPPAQWRASASHASSLWLPSSQVRCTTSRATPRPPMAPLLLLRKVVAAAPRPPKQLLMSAVRACRHLQLARTAVKASSMHRLPICDRDEVLQQQHSASHCPFLLSLGNNNCTHTNTPTFICIPFIAPSL